MTGIISFGDDVKTDRPGKEPGHIPNQNHEFSGVYVPVSKYYKWITQTIAHQEIPEYSLLNTCKNALCFY